MATYNVISIEQIHQEEQTRVWFEDEGKTYAIASSNGQYQLLDDEGYPVSDDEVSESHMVLYFRVASDYCGEDCAINEEYSV